MAAMLLEPLVGSFVFEASVDEVSVEVPVPEDAVDELLLVPSIPSIICSNELNALAKPDVLPLPLLPPAHAAPVALYPVAELELSILIENSLKLNMSVVLLDESVLVTEVAPAVDVDEMLLDDLSAEIGNEALILNSEMLLIRYPL